MLPRPLSSVLGSVQASSKVFPWNSLSLPAWGAEDLQNEACSEEREVQEYDEDLQLVILFLTLMKEMSGFILSAVNSPLFRL